MRSFTVFSCAKRRIAMKTFSFLALLGFVLATGSAFPLSQDEVQTLNQELKEIQSDIVLDNG